MKSFCLSVVGFLITLPVPAGEPGFKQTIAYVEKLQDSSGGFRPAAGSTKPTLRATSAAVRTLHYLGATTPNKEACVKFVESCFDADSGGFTDVPGGKPDVFTTAVGLMAVVGLNMPVEKYAAASVKYLNANAKSFEEIRIAVAGLEQLKDKAPKNEAWIKAVEKLQHADGAFGKGPSQARDTGGSVVALLRLGAKPADPAAVLKILKAGQRQNGGYGKDDPIASDLETTYRVMRCFVMLKARPDDVEGVRSFVAKCRNADGGYGVAPGQPSTISGAYFAAIITYWLKQELTTL